MKMTFLSQKRKTVTVGFSRRLSFRIVRTWRTNIKSETADGDFATLALISE